MASPSSGQLLLDLIALPSVNPAFLPPGDPRAGERAVGDYIGDLARRHGLAASLTEVTPGRFNVIARLTPSGQVRHRVLLAPHLDTVGFPALDEQLKPRVDGGRIFGRGACDTKGSVSAMLHALFEVARSGVRPRETEVIFVGLADEENGQAGSRHYARHGDKAELAIVGEPTRLSVVTAHKGDVWLRIKTKGRSAHGSTPHRGRNAIHIMARVVELIETEYARILRRHKHPLLGHGTVNVGSILGGTQPNIVPDECAITIDRRTLPGETEADVRRELKSILRRHRVPATFDRLRLDPCPALETDRKTPLVRKFCLTAGSKQARGVDYFCDAAPLAAGGIPSLIFGPGDIAQAHTASEWIAESSLEQGARIIERFLRDLA